MIGYDGLDPVFAFIEELIVIGGDMVLFSVQHCDVRYFDDHYHAYVVDHTSQQSLTTKLLDRNVYHARDVQRSQIHHFKAFIHVHVKVSKKCYFNPKWKF